MKGRNIHVFVMLVLILNVLSVYGQKNMHIPPENEIKKAPLWAQLMYQDGPCVQEVDDLYNAYYKKQPFQKNYHTQYYKKWRKLVEPYMDELGYAQLPSFEEKRATQLAYQEKIERLTAKNNQAKQSNIWTCLGPFETYTRANDGLPQMPVSWQSNVYTISQSLSNPNVLFCGTEGGGMFKTIDKGLNWEPTGFDEAIETITAIAVDPTNENIVYASSGDFIYKTSNGGSDWAVVHSQANLNGNEIIISPTDNQMVLLTGENGLLRSTDGGNNWNLVLTSPCWDVKFKTDDANTVFILQKNETQNICEFYKSTDAGASFTLQSNGWYTSTDPDRNDGGARMAVTDADANRIYAFLGGQAKAGDAGFIGLYRSDDAGESWYLPNGPIGGPYQDADAGTGTTQHWNLMGAAPPTDYTQGYYDMDVEADDANADNVILGGVGMYKSTDGGNTFEYLGGFGGTLSFLHPDLQEVEFNGSDMWMTTDGGIDYSTDFFASKESRKNGISAVNFWGFDTGWNEDVYVGGRYHNGNTARHENYPDGQSLRMGGAEQATGYVNKGDNVKVYFSDIGGGKIIPRQFDQNVSSFAVSKMPNESYFSVNYSEIKHDPRYFHTLYLGNENQLWKSIDNGATFTSIGTFGTDSDHPIHAIEVSRSNPEIIYCHQKRGYWDDGLLWKTSDGGDTWTSINYPTGRSGNVSLALSPTDENELWIAFKQRWNDGDPVVYKTDDGGTTWTDLSSPILDGENLHYILAQYGTDGGIYLGTNKTIYYKNDNMPNWDLYASGLPLVIETNRLRPFYRDSKIRLGAYRRGVWEAPLYEDFLPIAQPMVEKNYYACTIDTVRFSDFSALNHNGATWQWDFPGATWVSDATTYNPEVLYNEAGTYDVGLIIIDGAGNTSNKILEAAITIGNECRVDDSAINAMECYGEGDYVQTQTVNITDNTLSFVAWVKPNGIQPDYTGIVFNDEESIGMNFRGGNNTLGYHHPDGAWWWDSGLIVPADEWSHVAFVVAPSGVTVYVNGLGVTHNLTTNNFNLSTFKLGSYKGWGGRNYTGLIDEVSIWDKALSTQEIREMMHHTLAGTEADLVHYFQFNETTGSQILDKVQGRHASLVSNAARNISCAPLGIGTSQTQTETSGVVDFSNSNIAINYSAESGANVTASIIHTAPCNTAGISSNEALLDNQYFVVTRYDTGGTALGSISFEIAEYLAEIYESQPSKIKLYGRAKTSDDTWTYIGDASSVDAPNSTVSFNNIGNFNQFVLSRDKEVILKAKVFLGGFDAGSNSMHTQLNENNLLPNTQAYQGSPWNYTGTESSNNFAADVVDWVLLEIRDENDPNIIIEQRAGLLLNTGDIVAVDDRQSGVLFYTLTAGTPYHIVVRHRNHLDIISENPINLPNSTIFDFSVPANILGGLSQLNDLGNGNFGLIAGDYNADGIITVSDFNGYAAQISLINIYSAADFDGNNVISVGDFNVLSPNISRIGVPLIRY